MQTDHGKAHTLLLKLHSQSPCFVLGPLFFKQYNRRQTHRETTNNQTSKRKDSVMRMLNCVLWEQQLKSSYWSHFWFFFLFIGDLLYIAYIKNYYVDESLLRLWKQQMKDHQFLKKSKRWTMILWRVASIFVLPWSCSSVSMYTTLNQVQREHRQFSWWGDSSLTYPRPNRATVIVKRKNQSKCHLTTVYWSNWCGVFMFSCTVYRPVSDAVWF